MAVKGISDRGAADTEAVLAMKQWSLEHRAMRVSLVTGASTVLSIVFQLLSVPICLHFWGSENYGAWLAIFAASMMLRTVDGGFITYVGNRLNLLYHQNKLFVIDVSQSMEQDHPHALDFLRLDCRYSCVCLC